MGEIGARVEAGVSHAPPPEKLREFLRGSITPAGAGASYPRADARDRDRLPGDTWAAACIPAGVRFEFSGSFTELEVDYVTMTDDLGYRGDGAGRNFSLWKDGELVAEQLAQLGRGTVVLNVSTNNSSAPRSSDRWILYLPEGMKPTVYDIRAKHGQLHPRGNRRVWLAYGDSVAEGWTASQPARSWPAIVGRDLDLDMVNWGYAGAARGEIVSAQQIAGLGHYCEGLDLITVSHGTNCWTRIPFSRELMEVQTRLYLEVLRQGHPDVPILVISPAIRPDAETTPNIFGATLDDLRHAMEDATNSLIERGDKNLYLMSGAGMIEPDELADGIHPNDQGHQTMASKIGNKISIILGLR